MKVFILLFAALISNKSFAAEYTCVPAAIDIYFGSLPTFTLCIDASTDDSGNEGVTEVLTASFFSKKGNLEKQLVSGSKTSPDVYAAKHNSNLFLGDTEDRLYIQSDLEAAGAGDIIWFTTPESDPSHKVNKHRRYQCSKNPESP